MIRKALFARVALAALALVATAGAAWAAESGGKDNLFAGDLGNAVWTVVIFVLVVVVLGRFAWGPLLDGLKAREEFIRDSLAQARDDREAAEKRLAEYTEKLQEARAEATSIVEEGRRDADVLRGKIEEQARAEADKTLARAKREIEIAKQTAIKEIYTTSASLATDAASRIIGKELDAADHERLIDESIEKLGDLEAN